MSIQVTVDPDGPVLRFARRYPHPIEKVWAALTEPAQMSRWFPCEVQAEMRVGGTITLTFEGGEQDHAEITELEPPTAFGFTWADERLRWTLEPDGDGCVLRLSNTVLDPRWSANTAAGWDRCFETLAAHLGGSDLVTTTGPDEALIAHYRAVLGSGAPTPR
ncbi:SRPBCC family protein [Pseudonocardia alni]|uniref:SRPBCC family protein n=1 Tax=Pseudonocardia alni TaxID=33907 RepID=UPI00370FB858